VRGRGTFDIWRADLTAGNPGETATKLIYSTRTQASARYSPDGTRIAFQSNRSGSTEIWLTGADGADPERITSFNGPYTSAPSWCSDGRRIAFDSRASGVSAVYVEDISERVPRKVVTSEDNLSLPVWSQDCHWLFAIRNNNALYRFPAAGGRNSIARANQRLGNVEAMRQQLSNAQSLLNTLKEKWGSEAFSSYSSRPDIQAAQQQLQSMLAL